MWILIDILSSETNLDDVLQISNVFVNVSKGELAKSGDLQKAFGTVDVAEVVKEVCHDQLDFMSVGLQIDNRF